MPKTKRKRPPVRHPWDEWFKQMRFTLQRGKDFKSLTHCMAILVRNAAHQRGLQVQVFTRGKDLEVTVTGAYRG